MRAVTARALLIFSIGWCVLIGLLILLDIQVRWTTAPTTGAAWDDITRTYGPFNIVGYLVIFVSLLPAILANWLRNRIG